MGPTTNEKRILENENMISQLDEPLTVIRATSKIIIPVSRHQDDPWQLCLLGLEEGQRLGCQQECTGHMRPEHSWALQPNKHKRERERKKIHKWEDCTETTVIVVESFKRCSLIQWITKFTKGVTFVPLTAQTNQSTSFFFTFICLHFHLRSVERKRDSLKKTRQLT